MDGGRLRFVCHYCQTTSPKAGCVGCAELHAAWVALGTSHGGREIAQPQTVELSGPGLVLTLRTDPSGNIVVIVMATLTLLILLGVSLAMPIPAGVALILATLGAVCVCGIVLSLRGISRRDVLRLADGVLTTSSGSKVAEIRADTISQLVVHATHTAHSHRSFLRTTLRCVLLARTAQGDVPLLTAPLHDVRYIEALIERQLWIVDDPSQNSLATAPC